MITVKAAVLSTAVAGAVALLMPAKENTHRQTPAQQVQQTPRQHPAAHHPPNVDLSALANASH